MYAARSQDCQRPTPKAIGQFLREKSYLGFKRRQLSTWNPQSERHHASAPAPTATETYHPEEEKEEKIQKESNSSNVSLSTVYTEQNSSAVNPAKPCSCGIHCPNKYYIFTYLGYTLFCSNFRPIDSQTMPFWNVDATTAPFSFSRTEDTTHSTGIAGSGGLALASWYDPTSDVPRRPCRCVLGSSNRGRLGKGALILSRSPVSPRCEQLPTLL